MKKKMKMNELKCFPGVPDMSHRAGKIQNFSLIKPSTLFKNVHFEKTPPLFHSFSCLFSI